MDNSTYDITAVVDCAVTSLNDKKGIDTIQLHVSDKTVLADYFVISSGSSAPQVKALVDSVTENLKQKFSLSPKHIEGYETGRWVLLDYLDFVVHVLHVEEREFYSLEKIWSKQAGSSLE